MKLKRITIENFRCFESLTIDFEEDANVIVGVNGAGKSSLLDAIAFALFDITFTPYNAEILQLITKTGKQLQYTKTGEKRLSVTLDDIHIVFDAQDTFIGRKDYICFEVEVIDDSQLPIFWQQKFHYKQTEEPPFFDTILNTQKIHEYIDRQWAKVQEDPHAGIVVPAYYRAKRCFSQTDRLGNIFDIKIERPWALQNAMDAGDDYLAVCQWFYLRENSELRERVKIQDTKFEYPELRAVRNAIKNTIEDVERIYFDESTPPHLMVEVRKNKVVEKLSLNQLSDGYKNLLAMILDFARRLSIANPYMPNPLEASGILLIDEVELHLHPHWQQTIIPSLRKVFPNTQIIVTTHSPQVLTTVDHRCIRILKDNEVYTVTESTNGAEAKRMLEHILETESRPPNSEIGNKIKNIYDLINNNHLVDAQNEIDNLEEIKMDEPVILEAESIIKCKHWEKEIGL
ncbi:MAG: AAA family ATPase [Planctomycetaceae bacterium]|jgi:predicted ATP-binding protein involved in virulence|nr:AAA family ATPase [Planctomycetaceae bacterium]